jgi:transposase
VRFLRHLLQHIAGKILVIWDGSPIHRSRIIKAFLAGSAGNRLQVEQLPGYAPDLNPVEYVWRYSNTWPYAMSAVTPWMSYSTNYGSPLRTYGISGRSCAACPSTVAINFRGLCSNQ